VLLTAPCTLVSVSRPFPALIAQHCWHLGFKGSFPRTSFPTHNVNTNKCSLEAAREPSLSSLRLKCCWENCLNVTEYYVYFVMCVHSPDVKHRDDGFNTANAINTCAAKTYKHAMTQLSHTHTWICVHMYMDHTNI